MLGITDFKDVMSILEDEQSKDVYNALVMNRFFLGGLGIGIYMM